MASNKRNRYDLDFDDKKSRSSSGSRTSGSQKSEPSSQNSKFDTQQLSRSLEEQAESQIRKTRREITYTSASSADSDPSSRRRSHSSAEHSRIREGESAMTSAERLRERRRQRREAQIWNRAHFTVRILILLVLILDIIVLRFGVFKGGFLPVWNILTSGKSTVEQPAEEQQLPIQEQLLTVNEFSRPGTALDAINGIVIHYIGNPGADAQANRDYFENLKDGASGVYGSCHYIVGIDGTIIQCIPDNEVAYATAERNNDTISIQFCHMDDSGVFTQETYQSLVLLTAKLCTDYNLSTDQILRHYDVNQKPCPKFFVEYPDQWNNFIASVESCL
ncbi:MAG: peptidoglycan recognition family protein [Lachnospiraceae bacterium]|nr:peptidoglycan recognition family protein [Lachnospiraceae bacterium]